MTFEVWAPRPGSMRLLLDGRVIRMSRGPGDWWVPVKPVQWMPDADYGYLPGDSDSPLPDPRSRRQPDGVHGLSRMTSQSARSTANTIRWPPAVRAVTRARSSSPASEHHSLVPLSDHCSR